MLGDPFAPVPRRLGRVIHQERLLGLLDARGRVGRGAHRLILRTRARSPAPQPRSARPQIDAAPASPTARLRTTYSAQMIRLRPATPIAIPPIASAMASPTCTAPERKARPSASMRSGGFTL